MAGPVVTVDLDKIEKNTRSVVSLCGEHGIEVTAVTKVTCGMPQVAKSMLRGGAKTLGESRLENIHRLRANGIVEDMMLLRIPPLSETDEIVRSVDVSLNSEISVLRSLSLAAGEHGLVHRVILMIDLGDLREGLWPDDVLPAAREVKELPNLRLEGIGTNLTCYGGVIPTAKNMRTLVDWAHRIEDTLHFHVRTISGGNSSSLPLLKEGKMPKEVNHLRIGEAILLGRETVGRQAWPGTSQDAFVLEAEVIELKEKPSVPIGETGQDAFGGNPTFEDKGTMFRGILNVGREDVDVEGLKPVNPSCSILGASSDHLLVDLTACRGEIRIGDRVEFTPNYSALLAAMTSAYVGKRIHGISGVSSGGRKLFFFGCNPVEEGNDFFRENMESIGFSFQGGKIFGAKSKAWETEIVDFLREGGFPILCGKNQLVTEGYSAFSRVVENGGLLWISPSARIAGSGREHRSEYYSLGHLLSPEIDVLERGTGGESEKAEIFGNSSRKDGFKPPAADNLVLLGLQSVSHEENEIIRSLGITVYTMEDIDMLGISAVIRKALQRVVIGTQGLYVYYDEKLTDGGQEGLTNRETHLMMEMIARSGFMRFLDVSGVTPTGRTRAKLKKFVASALGKRILGI